MNNLQKLIRLRGLTVLEVAGLIGRGYHITQKVIKRTRRNQTIETAVAELLGLTHEQAWGPGSSMVLRRLISREIKEQARRQEESLRQQWLPNKSVPNKKAAGNV